MTTHKHKLVLGTVQLGMKYGIANSHGQPSRDEAFAILDTAFATGIDTFDTAHGYGSAEDILGEWIQERALTEKVRVISKMSTSGDLQESLTRLHVPRIDGYLLHSAQDMNKSEIVECLQRAKAEGLVKNIGVSVYDEKEALRAIELGFDYIQVPYNAFDQRLDKTIFFDSAKKNGVTVFARSPFLQGLLLMDPAQLPPYLARAKEPLEAFVEIAREYRLSPIQTALLFALEGPTEYVVFGVETLSQLSEILDAIQIDVPTGYREAIQTRVQVSDPAILNPSLWSKIPL